MTPLLCQLQHQKSLSQLSFLHTLNIQAPLTLAAAGSLQHAIVNNHICRRKSYVKGQLAFDHFNGGFTTTFLRVTIVIHIHHIHSVYLALHYIGIDVAGVHALKVTDVCKHKAMIMVPGNKGIRSFLLLGALVKEHRLVKAASLLIC